jgi:hypothetical protein
MKMNEMNKKLILAAAMSLVAAGLSNAATVYLTGSTALRSTVQTTLQAVGNTPQNVFSALASSTFYENKNYMVFIGTASAAAGGGPLTVKCHWSGSEAGIHDVASGLSQNFVTDAAADGVDHLAVSPTAGQLTSQGVDLAMADNQQDISQFNSVRGFPTVATFAKVCVITFKFVRNPGVWLGSNITGRQFIQSEGFFCPRAVFDGVAADINDFVYISGRDNGSGTRVNTFADTGFGPGTTVASQIEIDSTGNIVASGDVGFSSGGTLANTMGTSTVGKNDPVAGTVGQGFSVIAYMSANDAATAIGLGAVELTYDGVAHSRASIIEGQYTLWGNEFILLHGGASVTAQNVYTVLGPNNGIDANVGVGINAIRFADMHCSRTSPFSAPSHN